jgi:hypothetical protein
MRTCTRCENEKPEADFYAEKTCFDGLRPECKDCTKKAKLRLQSRSVNAAYMREYRARKA